MRKIQNQHTEVHKLSSNKIIQNVFLIQTTRNLTLTLTLTIHLIKLHFGREMSTIRRCCFPSYCTNRTKYHVFFYLLGAIEGFWKLWPKKIICKTNSSSTMNRINKWHSHIVAAWYKSNSTAAMIFFSHFKEIRLGEIEHLNTASLQMWMLVLRFW